MSALVALVLVLVPRAHAQDDARSLFERGTAAVHEGRFAEARLDLERSLSLDARAPTAFNLIVALRGIGALVAAHDVCTALLGGAYGALDAAQRGEAGPICAAIADGIAHLRIRIAGETVVELRIDGISLGEASPGEIVSHDVDPGAHALTILSPHGPPVDRALELERGMQSEIEVSGPPAPPRAAPGPDLGVVIGLSVGGAAALVAAVIVIVVVATAPAPQPGDFPVTATLRF